MNIHTFQVNDLGVNCYLLWDTASAEAALIDCGAQTQSEWERIRGFIEQKRLSLKYALLTHCHFDHIMGLPF
ncbi:MAG: MBL fold metallo-hydrolase, partial [Bacteroidaceae bacterium]|nr:MBL fold metallo-hydrolase [Bacteroidaceae bacterium]